ncbi:MAG: carbamate kinase [Hungatella sp.]|nr:carbamate kinase [Hungatella sp.]
MRVVIALGGNALGNNPSEQREAIGNASKMVADLIQEGYEVVLAHGNGPQVGMIQNCMPSQVSLSSCVSMSQAYIGLDMQNLLREELYNRGIYKTVVSVITQVSVEEEDRAFLNPTKPIGHFMTEEEARELARAGAHVMEDAGRGYRKVVASPKPVDIVEIQAIRNLVDSGNVVIACGGGGVPVVKKGNRLEKVDSVIDKDFASARLAQLLDADFLVLLTGVEKVAINYAKPDQKWLSRITVEEAREYIRQGQFAPGSMLPKIEAAVEFAVSKAGRKTLITMLEQASVGIHGGTGTMVVA